MSTRQHVAQKTRAVVKTCSSETKTETETGLDLNLGFETETGKVRDQDRDRKNDVINSFFYFLKKVFGVYICSKVGFIMI